MTEEIREIMKREIERTIRETVNGKIAALDKKIDAHMEEIKPFVQGAAGLSLLWKFCVSIGAIVTTYLAIRNSLKL